MPARRQDGPPLPAALGHTPSWTAGDVLLWMRWAFRTDPRTRSAAEIRPLNWPNDYLGVVGTRDWTRKRDVLLLWARCRAQGESFSELCRGRGWKPTRTYALRDAAAAEIAAGINAAIVRAHAARAT